MIAPFRPSIDGLIVTRILLALASVFLMPFALSSVIGDDKISETDRVFFENKIRPVLAKHCFACHSEASKKLGGNLFLDSRSALRKGGESGPVIVANQPNESLLIQALKHTDLEMPPDKQLPENVVNDFVNWIKRGAPDPRIPNAETSDAPKMAFEPLSADQHWSFFPRRDPVLPAVSKPNWPRDPLDQFVLRQLDLAGTRPTADAPPRVLIRRLYYDLIGLPPTFEQVESFVSDCIDNRNEAIEQVVDSLLAKPQFGERWARHWLDVARYGESNGDDGLGRNASFPNAWRYRDYVIEAFNNDTPYDRFITEQIAGDLLPSETVQQRNRQLMATGFLAIGSKPAAAMNNNFAMDVVDDQINVVSTAVMGLSVACARCHDHKHDPISTRDYYALAGIFSNTETLYGSSANEPLTAPPTDLHALQNRAKKQLPQPVRIKQTPRFPESFSAAINQLRPQFYSPLWTAPEAWKVSDNVTFTIENYAMVKDSNMQSELPSSSTSYSVAFWFKNDLSNHKRPITAYLFSRGDAGNQRIGDHLGIGGTHEKNREGRLFVFTGSQTKQTLAGPTVIPVGTWNQVVLVRDNQQLRLYLNGHPEPEFEGELPATFGDSKSYFVATRADKFAASGRQRGSVRHF